MLRLFLLLLAFAGSAWIIHQLGREQLAMLLGFCLGVLAGVPLAVALVGGNKSKVSRAPRVEVEIDGVWVEVPPWRR